jgi:hypothetical protein
MQLGGMEAVDLKQEDVDLLDAYLQSRKSLPVLGNLRLLWF